MLLNKSLKLIIFFYFVLSGVTWVSGETGDGILGRLAIADLIGLLITVIALTQVISSRAGRLTLPAHYANYIFFLLVFILGVLFSKRPELGLMELLVHVYIFWVSVSLLNLFVCDKNNLDFSYLLQTFIFSGFILAFVGLLQFLFLPNLFQTSFGGLSGTFRNTGQAGSFFGLFLALIVPGFLSGLIRPSLLNCLMTIVIAVALILTFKRAAWIGLMIGILGLLLLVSLSSSLRDKKIFFYVGVSLIAMIPIGFAGLMYAKSEVEGVSWRFKSKINAEAGTEFVDGFFADNLEASLNAFTDAPLIGVGAANVAGVYTEKYEIHSTYLKILATTGVIGSLAYIIFMSKIAWDIWKSRRFGGAYGQYLKYFFPFFVGLAVSWSYTYHLRKREFWIALALVSFCVYLSRKKAPR